MNIIVKLCNVRVLSIPQHNTYYNLYAKSKIHNKLMTLYTTLHEVVTYVSKITSQPRLHHNYYIMCACVFNVNTVDYNCILEIHVHR